MIEIWHYLLISLGINILMFIPAYIWKTDVFTDLSYALSFIILIIGALLLNSFSAVKLVVAIMVVIWGLRLGIFLFIRIRKIKSDKRFDGIRESFPKFLRFWVLQGLAVWVILVSALLFMISPASEVFWLGAVIWLLGLLTESIADLQKYRFSQISHNKGRFIRSGLWKYSRHPNYFGEITCWVGMYLLVFLSLGQSEKVLALASPLFIMILLIFVTGLPPLEKSADGKWGKDKDYIEYKRKTSVLIPWLPKN